MGRPREHDERTAEALLDAAEKVIQTEGMTALTVRGVADHVRTTVRAVYSLFGSRDGLLVALGTRAFDMLGAAVRGVPETDDPAADLVAAGVSVFRPFVVEHPALFRIGFRGFVPQELFAKFEASNRQALAGLVAKVDRLDQAGLLGGRSVDAAVCTFHALCEGLAEVELRAGLPPGAEEPFWRDALSVLVAGWQSVAIKDPPHP